MSRLPACLPAWLSVRLSVCLSVCLCQVCKLEDLDTHAGKIPRLLLQVIRHTHTHTHDQNTQKHTYIHTYIHTYRDAAETSPEGVHTRTRARTPTKSAEKAAPSPGKDAKSRRKSLRGAPAKDNISLDTFLVGLFVSMHASLVCVCAFVSLCVFVQQHSCQQDPTYIHTYIHTYRRKWASAS